MIHGLRTTDYGPSSFPFAYPARIVPGAIPSVDQAELLRLARSRARNPLIFEPPNEPYFFPCEISNDALDSWDTRMAVSSLQNYAIDAAAGVGLLDSHNSRRLPFGGSLTGAYEPNAAPGIDGVQGGRVISYAYVMRGIRFQDGSYATSDDYILAIEGGIVRYVSVGFYDEEYICSLCNCEMMTWGGDCHHWPGDKVETKDPVTGASTGETEIFAWVVNARLAEYSAVYKGATPGAMIRRLELAAERGLAPERVRSLERRYRISRSADLTGEEMSLAAQTQAWVNGAGELEKRYRGRRDDRSPKRGLSAPDVERLTAARAACGGFLSRTEELVTVPKVESSDEIAARRNRWLGKSS